MLEVLFFSNNDHKVNEIKKLFRDFSIQVYSPKDFNLKFEPNEKGTSFIENAKIKSEYGFKKTNLPCFSDDSGICIEALNWKPGIHSKKFLNSFNAEIDCFDFIINKVKESKKRRAYFQTSICYTFKNFYNVVFQGKINGEISESILGRKGFGYDPIFIPNGYSKSFGEMSLSKKNKLSHRSIAIKKLIGFLSN